MKVRDTLGPAPCFHKNMLDLSFLSRMPLQQKHGLISHSISFRIRHCNHGIICASALGSLAQYHMIRTDVHMDIAVLLFGLQNKMVRNVHWLSILLCTVYLGLQIIVYDIMNSVHDLRSILFLLKSVLCFFKKTSFNCTTIPSNMPEK